MTLRGILLDKDGTLIDFDLTWGPACYDAMRVLAEGDRGKLEALMEVSEYVEAERRFLPTSPLVAGSSANYGPLWADALGRRASPAFFREMDDLFQRFGLESLAPIGDPAGILATLAAAGFRLGIATNDGEASARAQAAAMRLDARLDYVAGYDSGFGPKPGPGMVLAFARAIGCPPREVALVGDSTHDLHAARAAGAVAVAVLTGPLGERARAQVEPLADHVIPSIAELPALAARLAAAPRRAAG